MACVYAMDQDLMAEMTLIEMISEHNFWQEKIYWINDFNLSDWT